MSNITRSREEIEERLARIRDFQPVSEPSRRAKRASILQLEWVLSPDEAAEDEADGGS